MAAVEAAGAAPDYEAAELYTRVFRVGALGRCWRQQLGPPDLSLATEAAAEADAAVAAELGCAAETAAELRAVCRTIIEWSESHDRGYGSLQSVKMEDYTFGDLSLKIGFPYLFCHQGNCEHIVIITDIRLIHHDDCLDRNLYPLLIKKHWLCTRKCFVCKMYTARWVTNKDSLAPEDPCFFCDVCFRMLHYDVEGNKLGEFLAYPYVDPGIFN